MPTVSETVKRHEQDSEQRHIDVPKIVQAGTVGKNTIYINGQLYEADVQDSQPGEVIRVANTGRAAAAKYRRLTLLDETTIQLADNCNRAIQRQMRATLKTVQRSLGAHLQQDLEALNRMGLSSVQSVQKSLIDVSNITGVVNYFLEEEQKIRDAEETLGIDWDKPETAEPYNDLPVSQVWSIADEIKRTDRAIKEGRLTDTAVVRYLQKRGAVQVAIANEPPHPASHGWDAVFDWYYRAPRYLCDGMEDLGRRIGYTYGYVRQKHMLYRDQYGERPIPR